MDVAGSAYAYNYFTLLTAATYGPSDNSAAMQVFGSTGSGGLTNTIKFVTGGSERWRITDAGILQSPAGQTIQTSTGNLTLATGGGNGHILLSPNGSGNVGIGTTNPTNELHIYKLTGPTLNLQAGGTGTDGFKIIKGDSGEAYVYNQGAYGLSIGTNNTQRIYITSTGNVGIGTTAPGALLEISSSTAASLLNVKGAGGNGILFVSGSGNVGIGTTSPTRLLQVNGTAYLGGYTTITGNVEIVKAGAYLYLNSTNSDAEIIWMTGGSPRWAMGMNVGDATENFNIYNYNTTTINLHINKTSGNVGIGTTSPTARLHVSGSTIITGSLNVSANITCLSLTETSTEAVKYNILPLPSQLDNVLKLKPVSFNYKANDKHSIGLIAEEVAKIYPEFTSDNNDSICYGKITSVLIQSIKELKTIIDNQQKQIENLIDKLK